MYLSHSLCIQCTLFVTIKALTLKAIPFIIINSNIKCISTCTCIIQLRNMCPKFACERYVHNLCICICVCVRASVTLSDQYTVYMSQLIAYLLLLFYGYFQQTLIVSQWILNNELRFGQLRNCVQVTIRLSTYSVTQTFEQVRVISTK